MKKEMLKKMKMPEMAQEDEMLAMDDSEMEEMPEAEMGEMEGEPMEASPLADISDDEMLKELEMRGFDVKPLLEKMEMEEPEDAEEMESPELQAMEEKYGTEKHKKA